MHYREGITDLARTIKIYGLKSQRLDTPFIRKNGVFEKTDWSNALKIIKEKIISTDPLNIGGFTGDLTNMETLFAIKEFVSKNNDLAAKYNLKNVLIMIDGEGDLASSNSEERMQAVENHKLWIDAASKMNCSAIRINLKGEKEIENWIKYSVESFEALGEYAKPLNINVIVENHGGLSSNASLLMKVINQVNLENCCTLPDFGNCCMSGEYGSLKDDNCEDPYDPYLGVSELLPRAFGLSAKSYEFDSNGDETTLNYYKLLSIAKDAGYTGYIGVEYEGEKLSEIDGIIATKKLLEKAASKI